MTSKRLHRVPVLLASMAVALVACATAPAAGFAAETSTEISCGSTPPRATVATSCTVTVSDSELLASPTGIVNLTTNGVGSFTPSNRRCTLSAGVVGASSCTFSYTPTNPGEETLTASYAGEGDFVASTGTLTIQVGFAPPHPTSAAVACSPESVPVSTSSTCSVTVTDTDPTPPTTQAGPRPPTGVATLEVDKPGRFFPETRYCTLNSSAANASTCSVLFAPGEVGEAQVSVSYEGTPSHNPATASTTLTATERPGGSQSPTDTALSCAPTSLIVGSSATCTVTVSDRGEFPASPAGAVAVSAAGGGLESSGGVCTLVGVGTGVSRCVFTYVPRSSGQNTVTAKYAGNEVHAPSENAASMAVAPLPVPPPPPPAPAPVVRPKLALGAVSASDRRELARSGRLTVRVAAPFAGLVKGRLLARLSKKSKTKVVGSASLRVVGQSTVRLTLRLSKSARAALKRDGRLVVRVETRFDREFRTSRFTITSSKARRTR